ncbi:MAG: iron-containing alcohol dehydrogenase [Ruminococcaceae bacterium]|nr:iron-containing alcohol dehydrogenase [Oscillospiraceae bacterium]MBR3597260.1 iron-containing alcohol dehydrogenase [Clostridia bacterium]
MSKLFNAYCRVYQKALYVGSFFLDWSKPELIKGAGAVKQLPEAIKAKGLSKVLVVTDKGLMSLKLLDSLFEALGNTGIDYVVFDGVQPNPTIDNIEDAVELYLENGCEGIVAFGGGSPMDCAKACGARIARPDKSVPQMRGLLKVNKKLPPLFAVPTTAGTGSETTIAAVVSNPITHEKNAINDHKLIPKVAVLDPELTVGLPKHITSTTGMDALTHAVEAYIGKSNTFETKKCAQKATKLIFDNLYTAYEDGKDLDARMNMLEASFYAGVAFTRAYVGYVHSIAHNLGGHYGIPHGLANAVILPYVLDYYGSTIYRKLAKLADIAGLDTMGMNKEQKAKLFISEIRAMNEKMGIPSKFEQIKEEDIPVIVERALMEANPLYPVPRIMDKKDCEAVIRQLMA